MRKIKESKLLRSFNIAISGLLQVIRSERNMKIHIVAAILVLVLSLFFKLTQSEMLFIILAITLVIITEIFNTSIEKLGDAITKENNELIKSAKDISASAVFVAAIFAIVVGVIVFHKRAQYEMDSVIQIINDTPVYLSIISVFITGISVILLKQITKKGTHLKGGFPSGHSAIAFCLATGIVITTRNLYASIFSFVIALMVAESRIETKVHSFLEVIFGGLLGIAVALLVYKLLEVII